MEDLFSIKLQINNEQVAYRIIFDLDAYHFLPGGEQNEYPIFSFKREHDEWHEQGVISIELKKQAEDALEQYLQKQH